MEPSFISNRGDRLLLLIARFQGWLKIQVYDTDHSRRAVDLGVMITKPCSGSGQS